MKRTFNLLLLVLLCLTLSSCKKIREPRTKGDLQTEAQVEGYITQVQEALREDLPKYDQWYKIDMESIANIYDEDESVDLKMIIKATGKIKDAEYAFESKGKIKYTVELKGKIPATENKSETSKFTLKYDMDLIIVEGKTFVKMDMNGKVDRNKFKYEIKSTWENINSQINSILKQLDGIIDIDIIGDFVNINMLESILQSFETSYFIEKLEDGLDDTYTNIYLDKKFNNKTYTVKLRNEDSDDDYDYEEKQVSILSFELFEDNYQLKNMSEYMYMYEKEEANIYEISAKVNINKCLFGSVKAPNDIIDYIA